MPTLAGGVPATSRQIPVTLPALSGREIGWVKQFKMFHGGKDVEVGIFVEHIWQPLYTSSDFLFHR